MPHRNATRILAIAAAFTLAALISACGGAPAKAPIRDQSVAGRAPETPTREVRAGDTLYSIAWESGRDYRELAEWNRITPPYVIRPGQRLQLYPPAAPASRPAPLVDAKPVPKPEPSKIPSKTPEKKSTLAKPRPEASHTSIWTWPADGNVIERFTPNGSIKGVGIAGRKGHTVRAAAPGTVVYQGSGLRGYGELIIIKHDADFLSAYAHNNKILVKEGDVIRRGQKIAEMGSSGTDRVKLHFEIRHRGTPVDPLAYLPKK